MEGNGQGTIVLPADPTRWEAAFQQRVDEETQAFAAVAPEHTKYFASDLSQLDGIEDATLARIAQIKQRTQQAFQGEEIQKLVEKTLREEVAPYEQNRVSHLVAEVERLKAQAPKPPKLSEIEQHRQTSINLYILGQLERRTLAVGPGRTVPADLNDPTAFSLLFETLIGNGEVAALDALLHDPMERPLRYLTPEQRERGQAVLGFGMPAELRERITGYELMVRRYRDRMAAMQRRFQTEGWSPGDPIAEMAKGGAS